MSPSEKLAEMFQMLPNIGPRQARRFVNYILSKNNGYGSELARLIKEIKSHYAVCSLCGKYFEKTGTRDVCKICADRSRDRSLLMTVANGADLDQIERSGAWPGLYFIIGGRIHRENNSRPNKTDMRKTRHKTFDPGQRPFNRYGNRIRRLRDIQTSPSTQGVV